LLLILLLIKVASFKHLLDPQLAGELISYPNILYLLRTKSLTRSDLRNDRSREVSAANLSGKIYIEVTEGRKAINVDEMSEVKSSWPP